MVNEERYAGSGGEVGNEVRSAKGVIRSFEDLRVYQDSYRGMLIIFKRVLPLLPREERYDLVDQLRRSCKAIPRLIAEGHSKRHQLRGFQKYIDDAHAESNETIVSIRQVADLYVPNDKTGLFEELIDLYDKISRQLFRLPDSWRRLTKYRR